MHKAELIELYGNLGISYLNLLQKLYESIIIPEAVYNEWTIHPLFKDEREKIAGCPFFKVEKAENLKSVRILRDVTGFDAGESETLIIYNEKQADLLLIDEHKGCSVAKRMSVEYIGTFDIFMLAYEKNFYLTLNAVFTARFLHPVQ